MEPSAETLMKTAYLALVKRAVPLRTQGALEGGPIQCSIHLPKRRMAPGTRRIMVLSGGMLELGFDIIPPGNVNVLRYRPGEWETMLYEEYRLAAYIFGEPPEPWLTTFSKVDRSLTASFIRKLLNVLLWFFGLHVSTTKPELRISLRFTPMAAFFWAISIFGIISKVVEPFIGRSASVALWLVGTFLSSLTFSLKFHKGYESPSYIKSLKHTKNNVQRLIQLIAHYSDEASLAYAQEALRLSTNAWQELQQPGNNVQKIELRLRRSYATVLLRTKIWASLCLAVSEERSLILFEEILIHPAKHQYISGIFNYPNRPAIVQLTDPTTWVKPLVLEANFFFKTIDDLLKKLE